MDLSRSIFTSRASTVAGGTIEGRRQRRRLRANRRAERHAARHASRARARSVTQITSSRLLDEDPDLRDTAEWRFDDRPAPEGAPDTIDLSDRPQLIEQPTTLPAPRHSDDAPLAPVPAATPAGPRGLADPHFAEPTLAAVLAGVASLTAWATLAPSSIWLPLTVLPAAGLMALLVPGHDLARLLRALILLVAAAVLPAISSAMTPVTLLIALAAAATYPLLTRPAIAQTITAGAVAALLTPLVVEALRSGPQAFIDSLIDPASGTQTAVRIALTSGIVVVGLVGTSAMATRRVLIASAQSAGEREQHATERERRAIQRANDTAIQLSSHLCTELTAGRTAHDASSPASTAERNRTSLEIELRDAIRSGAIEACYQPLLALGRGDHDDRIVGAETLPCWVSADGTDVPATAFLALADELGLGNQLGLQVLELALDAQLEWRHEGVGVDQVWVSLSPGQLRDPNLAHEISARLAVRGLSPSCLVLEVSAAHLAETGLAISSLSMLRSLGVAIALDDFGSSGTSLTSLRSLPISAVKLDRQLAGELDGPDVVASSIAQLGQTLGLRVVANGVETMRQLRGARLIGADAVQGHAIARAMSAQDVTNLLSLRLPREFRLS